MSAATSTPTTSAEHIELEEKTVAHNYHPLDVVLARGEGAYVWDVEGTKYLDALAGYSALNFGHGNERLLKRAEQQLKTLTLTARAFHNDQLSVFAAELTKLTGKDMILPMNSGAEAVETAIKVARRWGYETKGVPENQATIIVMDGNFHGRTTTIISFSDDAVARDNYGPYTGGFKAATYGSATAIEELIDDTTVAVLLEPIQGEGGVVIPPEGYLREVRELTTKHGILMIADEIQSGLARTGKTFACDHEGVVPDMYIMGKALGGGIMPVSAVAANSDVLGVITPGSHGSTFGGNPLAAAIGHEVCLMLAEGEFQERSATLGERLRAGLEELKGEGVVEVRVRGLWAGLDVDPSLMTGRELIERMAARGVLAKDTHGSTIRLAPPIVATEEDIDFIVSVVRDSLKADGPHGSAEEAAEVDHP